MTGSQVFAGYLDVKVSAKARRGLTPWKAWHKQWCEIKRLDRVEDGAELKLKASAEGAVISCVVLPRSATVCRIESRSKQFAFGVFTLGRSQKPLLFLSGACESDTQRWMELIRKTLSVAAYISVGSLNFHISLVDNDHSRAARLLGLYGIMSLNSQDITISDPTTGEAKVKWKWHQFHHFHLQAATHINDENKICIFHTSREFTAGPGQLHFFSKEAPSLLEVLLARGKHCKLSFVSSQRLSQSEGDLSRSEGSPNSLRNLSNSDDSGVRVSVSSDDSDCNLRKNSSSTNGIFSKTPGGSEADEEDSSLGNLHNSEKLECRIPRGESGVSLASGVYEEIPDIVPVANNEVTSHIYTNSYMLHVYEDPKEVSRSSKSRTAVPPPLPPRVFSNLGRNCDTYSGEGFPKAGDLYKCRSNTLPARDLKRLSEAFASEADYTVMVTPKSLKAKNESLYMPMSPIVSLKSKLESCYMIMSGKKC